MTRVISRVGFVALLATVTLAVVAPSPAAVASPAAGLSMLYLEPLAEGFESPVFMTGAGDSSGHLLVVEQAGRIMRLGPGGEVAPEPFLDIADRVLYHNERGLLGMALHPDFRENGRFYVAYSRRDDGATMVSEFSLSAASEQQRPVEATQRPLLVIAQPYTTHKGGMLAFDHDGMLLIGSGDGGSGNDPQGHALDGWSLLGKLLRIDVDGGWPYAIPADNGFAGRPDARGEIHAIGLRNPWRFSVDAHTGDVYIGDVGQGSWEEIDVLPRGARAMSFGWAELEGPDCLAADGCDTDRHEPPAIAYRHADGDEGSCGVIGGYAYRGRAGSLPLGTYLYGDYCSGTIWAVPADALVAGPAEPVVAGHLDPAFGQLVSFGQDDDGELYVVTSLGHVLRVREAAEARSG